MSADWLVAHEGPLRLAAFVVVLGALVIAERVAPFRGDARPAARQARNLALVVVGTAVLRLMFPLLAVGAALWARARGVGAFNVLDWSATVEAVIAFLALDLAIYFQHRVMHALPPLWRLHRMHHSDVAFDVTTGVRFHPLEIALSMAIKIALVVALGADPLAVLAFEIVLSMGSLFTHCDIALPARMERLVRAIIVTPSMHRVHHSPVRVETDSNFGFNLSCWDRLFRSYRDAPAAPERTMTIGLPAFREPAQQTLAALLLQPLREPETNDA